tara:strand:- start:4465 stop:5754 length:1290 start_codon:yes stop_codon:yes gene_type:complete
MNYTNIYTPSSLEEAQRLAELFATKNKSPLDLLRLHATFGHHFGSNMAITAQQGYVIRDTPALGADAMAGIVRNSGICKYIQITEWDNNKCSIELARSDEPKSMSHTFTFSMDMAKRQGIARGRMWEGMPMQMLRARCMTLALRAVFPDVVSGIYSADEIADSTDLSETERAQIQAESLGEEIKMKPSRAPQPVPPVQPTEPPKPKAKPVPKPKPISYNAVNEPKPAPKTTIKDLGNGAPVTIDFNNLGEELKHRCDLTEEQALKVWSYYAPNINWEDAGQLHKVTAFYKLFCSPIGRLSYDRGGKLPTHDLYEFKQLQIQDENVFNKYVKAMDNASNGYHGEEYEDNLIPNDLSRLARLAELWSNPIFAETNIAMNQGIGSLSNNMAESLKGRYHETRMFNNWDLWHRVTNEINAIDESEFDNDNIPF